jgi:hypothetical protein
LALQDESAVAVVFSATLDVPAPPVNTSNSVMRAAVLLSFAGVVTLSRT